jgi:hypothetical protein
VSGRDGDSYLELGLCDSMLNLEAVVHGMGLDDRHRPGRVDEGRSRGRGGGVVERIERIAARSIDGKEPLAGHREGIRKGRRVKRDIKLCHRSKEETSRSSERTLCWGKSED